MPSAKKLALWKKILCLLAILSSVLTFLWIWRVCAYDIMIFWQFTASCFFNTFRLFPKFLTILNTLSFHFWGKKFKFVHSKIFEVFGFIPDMHMNQYAPFSGKTSILKNKIASAYAILGFFLFFPTLCRVSTYDIFDSIL